MKKMIGLLIAASLIPLYSYAASGSCVQGQVIKFKVEPPSGAGVSVFRLPLYGPTGQTFRNVYLNNNQWDYVKKAWCVPFGVKVQAKTAAGWDGVFGLIAVDPTKAGSGTVTINLKQCPTNASYYISSVSSMTGVTFVSHEEECSRT